MASREFTDSNGVAWNVWSVTPSEMSSTLTRLAGLTNERREPWLVFQSAEGEKRRLVPIPGDWLDCEDALLERHAMRAVKAPPAPARRSRDRGTGPGQ